MAKAKQVDNPAPPAPTSETPKHRRRRPYVEPTPTAPPKAEDYELEDSSFDPDIDMAPSVQKEPEPTQEKPRDETGKFTKKPHPGRLVNLARELNIGEDEIAHSSTAELRATVQEEQMRLLLTQQQDRHRSNLQEAIQATPPPAPEEPEPQFPELDEANPALAKFLKQQSAELKQLKNLLLQQQQISAAQSRHQVFDAAFAGLGKDYEKFFGAGGGETAGRDNVQRRNAIIAAAGLSEKDGRAQIAAKIQAAAKNVYGSLVRTSPEVDQEADVDDAPAHRNGRITEEQWNSAGLPKPNGTRRREMPKGQQRAAHAVADKMREHRITEEDFDTLEEQNLPD